MLLLGRQTRRLGPGGARPHRGAPHRREQLRRLAWATSEPVSQARRLAGEGDPAAGAEHPEELAERPIEVGQVVQHGVAEDEVKALSANGSDSASARAVLTLRFRRAALTPRVLTIPGEMSVQVASRTTPAWSMFRLK